MSNEVEHVESASLEVHESVEDKARKMGWVPPEEAVKKGLDPKEAKSAEVFLALEKPYKDIKQLRQDLRILAKQNYDLMSRWDKAEIQNHQQTIQQLEAASDDAIDPKQIRDYTKQIKAAQDQIAEIEKRAQANNPSQMMSPEVQEFIQRNSDWFGPDKKLTTFAQSYAMSLEQAQPGISAEAILAEVQKAVDQMRGVIPEVKSTKKQSYVAAPSNRGNSSPQGELSAYGFQDLKPDAQRAYKHTRDMMKDEFNKDYSVEQYIKDSMKAQINLSEIVGE